MSQGLFVGRVHHARFGEKRHRLAYRIFMVLIDLPSPLRGGAGGGGASADAPAPTPPFPGLFPARGKRRQFTIPSALVWGRNRPGLISLWDKDHGDGSATPLRAQIEALAQRHGRPAPTGRVEMLCMPRVLGRGFNPLSVYYCHDADGRLETVVFEVNNTFGARHWYVLAADRQRCGKAFFVSPFMDQDLAYDFDVVAPDERAFVGIRVSRQGQTVLTASFNGDRRELTAANLIAAWASHPLQTVGVLAGIYVEGLKLLLKGFRWRSPQSAQAAPSRVEAV